MIRTLQTLLLVSGALASPLAKRDDLTATVDLSVSKGTPQHLASGFIYGIPDVPNDVHAIQDHWYTDIDFQYGRVGGGQLAAPYRGWIYGLDEYYGRFNSTRTYYEVCRKYDAGFVMLPHDIWGTDHSNDSTVWPGDDGDWTDYEKFVKQLLNDLYDNDMLEGLVWDIWNEPDIETFWVRGIQQWVDLYILTHKLIRADSRFDSVLISGPTLAYRPMASDSYWTTWLAQIAGNDTVPDQWAYHLEGSQDATDNDPAYTNASLSALLEEYGLPGRPTNINEYAEYSEQVPTGYAWWIARLERYEFQGLLGNWMSSYQLHDLFANVLTKTDDPDNYTATDYAAAPGYWVYKYYAQNMTGHRVETAGSGDGWLDVYATVDTDTVRLLVGTKIEEGTWEVQVSPMSAVGYATEGSVTINTWGFLGDESSDDPYIVTAAPTFRNTVAHTYTNDTLTFPIYQTDTHSAWAFEFDVLN